MCLSCVLLGMQIIAGVPVAPERQSLYDTVSSLEAGNHLQFLHQHHAGQAIPQLVGEEYHG
jgi:hypothetical protein